jgi:hypothetical protein
MQIRSSERKHEFTNRLFRLMEIYSLGGLTLNRDRFFTAGVEAVQFSAGEKADPRRIFNRPEVEAKYYLASLINVPLYFLVAQEGDITIYQIVRSDRLYFRRIRNVNYRDFPSWWAEIKQTKQPKPIYEASDRIKEPIFDTLLEKAGLAWGGNIDGFILRDNRILAIIENIYTNNNPLESRWGEPAPYFMGKGPNYNTWEPTVMLANILGVPLFLFTFEGKNNKERIGFTVIDYLSTEGIYYKGPRPNENIISGIEAIQKTINDNLGQAPPYVLRQA